MSYLLLLLVGSCKKENKLFVLRDDTGIKFENTLDYTEDFNPYTYRNFYNGAGVSVGDINNDGLIDIYITGNIVPNKLYLNLGNFKFRDITNQAGVACENVWSTGSALVDINGDGLLDIYVCKSGKPSGKKRHNELFINNGDLTFSERSKEYGLDFTGLSVHASFFDFDKDGDLDCYLLSNSIRSVGGYDLIEDQRNIPSKEGNKFLVNENGFFVDKSDEVGIYTSEIGFGLGITISDFNGDSWDDIYVSNDFFERDYLYLNNKNGGFNEKLEENFKSISMGSMGADVGDLNNDLLPDLFVTEMLPKSIERKRTKTIFESWDKYSKALSKGYFHQFPRNTLQRNMGKDGFFEVGRLSGISSTEWSWASLFFDADNDGLKDIFISNGIYKDLLDRDYLTFTANDEKIKSIVNNKTFSIKGLIDLMPSKPVVNHMYKNKGDFNFEFVSNNWGLDHETFSNGSAYADFDNDGDLDLIVNNVNMPFYIYENNLDTLKNRSLKINLLSDSKNTRALGSKIIAYIDKKPITYDNHISKGFQSSINGPIHLGVGNTKIIDSIEITWPNSSKSIIKGLNSNQTYTYSEPLITKSVKENENLEDEIKRSDKIINFNHKENKFIDFNIDRLIPEMISNEGPALSLSDVNNDGIDDFFVGGAKFQNSKIFISHDNKYIVDSLVFSKNRNSEDVASIFFDADGDSDKDLYVCSGGRAFSNNDIALKDRIYINDGKGNFKYNDNILPKDFFVNSSSVTHSDFNNDGLQDLFVGQRTKTRNYGLPGSGYLMYNSSNDGYKIQDQDVFSNIGMITDVKSGDINNDGWDDIVVVGEWMNIKIFINNKGVFKDETDKYGVTNTRGFWKSVDLVDIDDDGDVDIVAGNLGQNSYFKKGDRMYVSDFDNNGTIEQIICHKIDNKFYPIVDRNELISQLPSLKKKFVRFENYSSATINDLFQNEKLNQSLIFNIDITESIILYNEDGIYKKENLPIEAQYTPIYSIKISDVDNDNAKDIFLGGNQFNVKPQFGRHDASKGLIIYGKKIGNKYSFKKVNTLGIDGQIRNFAILEKRKKKILVSAINNGKLEFNEIN